MNKNKLLTFGIIFTILTQGCKNTNGSNKTLSTCPNEATAKLETKNVEDVALTSSVKNIDGMTANSQPKGYRFTGKKDQKIIYQIKPNGICVWLYDSNNNILSSPSLPRDGTYILQIASSEGSGTFQLNLSINNIESTSEKPSNQNTKSPESSTQPSPVSKIKDNRPSAVEAVRSHYTLINNGNLNDSWNNLSSKFQNSNVTSGRVEYDNWWNQVKRIDINSITLIRQNTDRAIVRYRLTYTLKTGKVVNDTHDRLYLIWDESNKKWLIDDRR
jgi:hypothetical protein